MPIELAALLSFTVGLISAQALHLYRRARAERAWTGRALDEPCPGCRQPRWLNTISADISGRDGDYCLCGYGWPSQLSAAESGGPGWAEGVK